MNAALLLQNLAAYSLQLLLIVAVGAALPAIFRLRSPRARLFYWQTLLLCCLALPALEPWRVPADGRGGEVTIAVSGTPLASGAKTPQPLSPASWALWLLAAGWAARTGWLGLGLFRLQRYRTRAVPLDAALIALREMSLRLGVWPDLYVSEDVQGPVTFGAIFPAVIFPRRFLSMNEDAQRSIVCHEFLHIRRRDWPFTIAEEFIRCGFWFHPAVWWMLSRIQLSREQAVDHAAVLCIADRAQYLETLLDAAAVRAGLDPALAPLFLRKRHLSRRVASLLKETPMSKRRLVSSLVPIAALALFAVRLSVLLFPLSVPAQEVASGPGVTVDLGPYKLLHGSPAVYPEAARDRKIEGAVQLEANVDDQGAVTDARVLGGPTELRKEALEAVLS
ncbi:MAG: M56 family metallopeptidase, partial [Bryobacteraceae bacterium]